MHEKQLLKDCLNGSYKAQKELYGRYSSLIMGICMRYAACQEEAEDILQESFIKVFRNLRDFEGRGALGAWIRKIVVNTALQKYRENKNSRMHITYDKVEYLLEADDDVLKELSAEDLMLKIQNLPTGYRTVFNLYAIEGFNHIEISKELGISVGTSKSQFSRARAMLRKQIEDENEKMGLNERAI